MGCCCKDAEQEQKGMVENRRCRDVLFLLIFVAYWVGMFVVCGIAFEAGDPNRLIYGVDSHGLLCGSVNPYHNTTIDLTSKPNLYYLNALDLLDANNLLYAKAICVSECPTEAERCSINSLPCTENKQYRCPYYRMAEDDLYGRLPSVNSSSVDYWDQLGTAQLTTCDSSFLQAAQNSAGINLAAFGVNVSMCAMAANVTASVSGKYLQAKSQFPGEGPCYPVWAATVPYFNRCFPKFPENFTSSLYSVMDTTSGVMSSAVSVVKDQWSAQGNQFTSYVADISKGVLIIVVGGLAVGMGVSLVWMLILRYFAGLMVWVTIAVVNAALVGCTLYAYNMSGQLSKAGQWGATIAAQMPAIADPTGMSRENWAYIAYAVTAVCVVVFLLTLVMLPRVRVAVACIKVASQAVSTMPSILLFPILPFILEVGLIIYWVAVTAVLYSAGHPTDHWRAATDVQPLGIKELMLTNSSATPPPASTKPNTTGLTTQEVMDLCAASPDCYISYDWNNQLMYAFIYHLFGLLWTNQFIVGFCSVVVAGAVANYYWSRGGKGNHPTFPVLKALRNTVIFHLGSIALGAFIIAVIQMIRLMLEYLDKKTRTLQQQNKIAQWLMCIVKCMMWCLEKIVAFINRNAFILVAVKGTNYCSSAARAVQLIVANALRLAAVNVVGDALLFLGKLGVAACCGVVAFFMSNLEYYNNAEKYPATYLSSGILPIAVAVLTGYIVAQIFFSVYEMAIDTVLLSFCEDCESNGGHPKCAPPLLLEALGEKAPTEGSDDPYNPQKPQHQGWN